MKGSSPRELKCSSCGAPLHCRPGKVIVRCAHCGTEFAVDEAAGGYHITPVPGEAEPEVDTPTAAEPPIKAPAKRGWWLDNTTINWIIGIVVVVGFTLVSCLLLWAGYLIFAPTEHEKELIIAKKLLEQGRVVEAERKFRWLGEYENYKDEIEAKKKEKQTEIIIAGDMAYRDGNFELAIKSYDEAREFGPLGGEVEARYSWSEASLIKEGVEQNLVNARDRLENGDYYGALEEVDKAIEGCDDLDRRPPDVVEGLRTEETREEAVALRDEINEAKEDFERETGIPEMAKYQQESGDIGVAVFKCKLSKAVRHRFGSKAATGDSWYVWVNVSVKNFGEDSEHVSPGDFTLSTPSGETTGCDDVTYSLEDEFEGVRLPPGGSTSGWMVFETSKESHYRLNFYGSLHNQATKEVYVTEGK